MKLKETCSIGHERHQRREWRYQYLCDIHNLRVPHCIYGTPIGKVCKVAQQLTEINKCNCSLGCKTCKCK